MRDLNQLNKHRIKKGPYGTKDGQKGAFSVQMGNGKGAHVIVDDGAETGWEHVSVHIVYQDRRHKLRRRSASWSEMCKMKEMFFKDTEAVIQFHPEKADHINFHPHVLHLWRQVKGKFPMPPKVCV